MLLSQKSLTEQQRIENTLLVVFCLLPVFWMAILLFVMGACMAFRFWSLAKGKTNRNDWSLICIARLPDKSSTKMKQLSHPFNRIEDMPLSMI